MRGGKARLTAGSVQTDFSQAHISQQDGKHKLSGNPHGEETPHENTITQGQNFHGGKSKPRPHVRNNALLNVLPKQPLEITNKPVQIQTQIDKTTVIPVVP